MVCVVCIFFFSSRRRHTRCLGDWSSDVCSSDLVAHLEPPLDRIPRTLRRVVRRCLRKEPELRYDSLRDAALDLRESLGETDAPRPRRRWGLAALPALPLLALAAWLVWPQRQAKP